MYRSQVEVREEDIHLSPDQALTGKALDALTQST